VPPAFAFGFEQFQAFDDGEEVVRVGGVDDRLNAPDELIVPDEGAGTPKPLQGHDGRVGLAGAEFVADSLYLVPDLFRQLVEQFAAGGGVQAEAILERLHPFGGFDHRLGEHLPDLVADLVRLEGLDQILVHVELRGPEDGFPVRGRGAHHDVQLGEVGRGANLEEQLQAVHFRHADVGDHQVRIKPLSQQVQRLGPIDGFGDRAARQLFDDPPKDQAADVSVLDNQDVRIERRADGFHRGRIVGLIAALFLEEWHGQLLGGGIQAHDDADQTVFQTHGGRLAGQQGDQVLDGLDNFVRANRWVRRQRTASHRNRAGRSGGNGLPHWFRGYGRGSRRGGADWAHGRHFHQRIGGPGWARFLLGPIGADIAIALGNRGPSAG
jgi:hypothetical protein